MHACQNGPMAIEVKFGLALSGPATGLSCESTSTILLSCHTAKAETLTDRFGNAKLDQTLNKFEILK